MQIALVDQVRDDRASFAFRAEAVNVQMQRDFAPAWRDHLPPGIEPWNVVPYVDAPPRPSEFHPIFEKAALGSPDYAGWHDDLAGYVYGCALKPASPDDATTASHEALEMNADPPATLWVPLPDGLREVALEVGDPVEADSYPIRVGIAGVFRTVWVSNFALPAWFDPQGRPPYDFMQLLAAPFAMRPGGYTIVRDLATLAVDNVFADAGRGDALGHASRKILAHKRADPHSRTARRLLTVPGALPRP